MRKILHCRIFIRAHYAKNFNIISFSDFSREFFAAAINFLYSNSNMYTSKISMVKAILDIFIENKDENIILNNSKQILTK